MLNYGHLFRQFWRLKSLPYRPDVWLSMLFRESYDRWWIFFQKSLFFKHALLIHEKPNTMYETSWINTWQRHVYRKNRRQHSPQEAYWFVSGKSMGSVINDLQLNHLWVVYPGKEQYPLAENITVLPLTHIGQTWQYAWRSERNQNQHIRRWHQSATGPEDSALTCRTRSPWNLCGIKIQPTRRCLLSLHFGEWYRWQTRLGGLWWESWRPPEDQC